MNMRKILSTALAAVMAVSAMRVTAFAAEDDKSDANKVVLTVMGEDGNQVDYTQAELDALNGEVPAYGGAMVVIHIR